MGMIGRLLAPPTFAEDERKTQLARVINVIALGFAAFTLVILVGIILGKNPNARNVFYIVAFGFLGMFPVKYGLHHGKIIGVQIWLLVVLFVCVTAAIVNLGTIRAPVTAFYLAGVVIAGLLFKRQGIFYATAVCSMAVGGLTWAEAAGWLPKPDFSVGITQWITYTSLYGFTGSLIYAINQVTQDALLRAETELVQRKQTEVALNAANQKLSQRVQEVENLQKELHEQALRDGLTGLYNRRYMADALDREIARTLREKSTLCFVMVDVDHFKGVNDSLGHQAGDAVLVRLARLLTGHARGSDIVCRYGGEEFLLLLPGTSLDFAVNRAEEIRRRVAGGVEPKVTISIGIASYPEHGRDWAEVVSKADKALYQSKHHGRDRVTVWRDSDVAGKRHNPV